MPRSVGCFIRLATERAQCRMGRRRLFDIPASGAFREKTAGRCTLEGNSPPAFFNQNHRSNLGKTRIEFRGLRLVSKSSVNACIAA